MRAIGVTRFAGPPARGGPFARRDQHPALPPAIHGEISLSRLHPRRLQDHELHPAAYLRVELPVSFNVLRGSLGETKLVLRVGAVATQPLILHTQGTVRSDAPGEMDLGGTAGGNRGLGVEVDQVYFWTLGHQWNQH